MLNERQLASYTVVLLNHQRLVAGQKKKRIEWGNEEEKPDHHPDNILNWVDLKKSPGNMSAAEFMNICKKISSILIMVHLNHRCCRYNLNRSKFMKLKFVTLYFSKISNVLSQPSLAPFVSNVPMLTTYSSLLDRVFGIPWADTCENKH